MSRKTGAGKGSRQANQGSGANGPNDPRDAAAYIKVMAEALHGMARMHDFDVLAYLLRMAREESENLLADTDGK